MARLIAALLLGTATTALQQPNIRPRAPTAKNAVPCAEADALLAQARHLRDQAEIEERQLRALRAEAKPQAVEGKNNILPLERLKAWSRAVSFETPSFTVAASRRRRRSGANFSPFDTRAGARASPSRATRS